MTGERIPETFFLFSIHFRSAVVFPEPISPVSKYNSGMVQGIGENKLAELRKAFPSFFRRR